MNLVSLIKYYYEQRKLKWPNQWEAMAFVNTELAEIYELFLSESGGWVRNNPQNKPSFDKEELGKEIGDAIFMLIVTGIVTDTDPITALVNKINNKLMSLGLSPYDNRDST